jgi:hypothetical protein
MTDFSGWMPMRIYWRESQPMVDWGHLGARRFTDPFFAQTINHCVTHPADVLFRHQTPLEQLGELTGTQPGLRPTGFIFHMSRCGSTLISQMLAASAENIVLSEPDPVDGVLRAHLRHPNIPEERRVQWLQWLIGALARRRHASEKHLFIKFDCWHARFMPLIQRAFPEVPWVFVYRDPLEVMASHLGHRGAQMIPGVLEASLFGWDQEAISRMGLNEYGARVLAGICEAALAQVRSGQGKLLNYCQLPAAIWPELMRYWGVEFAPDETRRMMEAGRRNAKNPVMPFAADSQAKRDSAPPELRAVTRQWLDGVYQQLESQRLAGGFA